MPYPTANLGFTGHLYKSIDTQTTLMKLFLLAYRPQVMTELYGHWHCVAPILSHTHYHY